MKRRLPEVILASRSVRRSTLLAMCRIRHRVMVSNVREDNTLSRQPSTVVVENALRKARRVARWTGRGIVIGADTVVYLDGKIVGKLRSRAKVKATLRRLCRRASSVYTGIVLIDSSRGSVVKGYAKTRLKMKRIGEADLDAWMRRIGPFDRAGGFSIEGPGSILFPSIEGCYFNIVGLPMSLLYDLFGALGYNLLDFMKEG